MSTKYNQHIMDTLLDKVHIQVQEKIGVSKDYNNEKHCTEPLRQNKLSACMHLIPIFVVLTQ